MSDEQLKVVVHVLLELTNTLGTEGVGHGLALAGVLCSVASVEKTTANTDKSIIVIAAS